MLATDVTRKHTFQDVFTCLVYLDDVLVHTRTFPQAIANLDQVFGRLGQAGLKLSPEKCTLFATEVAYLGRVIGRG